MVIFFTFVTFVNVENIVVSLGPYPLYNVMFPRVFNSCAKLIGNCSPASIMYFKFLRLDLSEIFSNNNFIREGVV